MNTLIIAVIAAFIIVILFILKSRSVSTIEHPCAQSGERSEKTPAFRGFEGECDGVKYVADSYDPTTVTIEIEANIMEQKQLEVNAREKRPGVMNDERAREIESLLDHGADYLDIGYNTDRVAAEFPISKVAVSREFAEKITCILVKLKDKSI